MAVDWDAFLSRLQEYPPDFHRILPPPPEERVVAVEKELGRLPATIKEMLRRFNGAKLFISTGPSFSVFGISTSPLLPAFDWAPDWYIDKLTPKWRSAGSGGQGDWAIAMTNYGGLILLDADETVKEWDTGQSIWLSKKQPLDGWIEKVIRDGEIIMAESS